jgi:DNA-binding NtrC family response regulator
VSALRHPETPRLGSVLVVDDEPLVLRAVGEILRRAGYAFRLAGSGAAAQAALADPDAATPDVILTDLHLTDVTGIEILTAAQVASPSAITIVMTGRATVSSAVDAMRRGAFDYLAKPFEDNGILLSAIERAMNHKRLLDRNRFLEERLGEFERSGDLVGTSAAMRKVASLVATVGPTEASVLVHGESGTGKELVVRALHRSSKRRDEPLFAINCGALAESVLESELFGHAKGAFTGALTARKGLFEAAAGSTVFLDEIGETPPSVQVRLLRVLQEREVKRLGENESRPVDVRVVAATNRDLAAEVAAGRFRQDLFYRLNVVSIEVPPLRARLDDVPLLATHFLRKHAARHGRRVSRLDPAALELLMTSDWPGNVRELENAIERAVVLSTGDVLVRADLSGTVSVGASSGVMRTAHRPVLLPLASAKQDFERDYLQRLMTQTQGRLPDAARLAGLDRSNLRRLLRRFDLLEEGEGPESVG